MAEWYFQLGGRSLGPITPQRLAEMALDGRLAIGDLVRREDQSAWVKAQQLKGLRFAAQEPPPEPPPPTVSAKAEVMSPPSVRVRLVAEFIAILKAVGTHAGLIAHWLLLRYGVWQNQRESRQARIDHGREMFEQGFGSTDQRDAIQGVLTELAAAEPKQVHSVGRRRDALFAGLANETRTEAALASSSSERLSRLTRAESDLRARLDAVWRRLLPADSVERRRVVFGYGTIGLLGIAIWYSIPGRDLRHTHNDGDSAMQSTPSREASDRSANAAIDPAVRSTPHNASPESEITSIGEYRHSGEDLALSKSAADVFKRPMDPSLVPPKVGDLVMGMTPDRLPVIFEEIDPPGMSNDRTWEKEIRVYSCDTPRKLKNVPEYVEAVLGFFAGQRLYKVVYKIRPVYSNLSQAMLTRMSLPRNIPKSHCDELEERVKADLQSRFRTVPEVFVDRLDLKFQPFADLTPSKLEYFKKMTILAGAAEATLGIVEVPGGIRMPMIYLNETTSSDSYWRTFRGDDLFVALNGQNWETIGRADDADGALHTRWLIIHHIWIPFEERYGRSYVTLKKFEHRAGK